ncbi:hypothetical protein Poly24_50840 [Rosistilla carotiformis]|uniref:Sulfatase n=1 Tax=Rosistilla carotiformis TaxID=2528017 RepID=A0A518K0M6_9BACT|nr:hypothetical protein [Rosistilla carotiformis]QDV71349.1 hypothetical protein Poly24_50840 [Rosistilla carotiformis]
MPSRAVVLSVDGLAPASLQPYGCSWQPTPNLNQLAAKSLVFERCYADSLDPIESLGALLSGTHAAQGPKTAEPLYQSGAVLVVDDSRIADLPLAKQFENQVVVPYAIPATPREEVEQTALAQLFASGIDAINDPDCRLCWLHASSLPRCWDVPRALCHADDEMMLPEQTTPPELCQHDALEPDEMLAWMAVYGGQVRLLDILIGIVADAIESSPECEETLLIVIGTSGMALGENDRFGFANGDHRSVSSHVPLIVRIPRQDPLRSLRICQPWEVAPTLRGWLEQGPTGLLHDATPIGWTDAQAATNWALTVDSHGAVASFQTPWWNLCRSGTDFGLFRKPDDRFDSNDIASRVPDMVDLLRQQAEQAMESLKQSTPRHALTRGVMTGQW